VSIFTAFAAAVLTSYNIPYQLVLLRLGPHLGPAMPRRYQPTQLVAVIIIGIVVALVVLMFYHRAWL
jgi:hypothetical protein